MNKRLSALIKKDLLLLGKNIYIGFILAISIPLILGFSLSSTQLGVVVTIDAYLTTIIYTVLIIYW